jgi:hypothetical protein
MSEESVEVVRGVFEAFLCGDFERGSGAYDPEVEWDGTELPDGTIARGHDAVVNHVTRWGQPWGENYSTSPFRKKSISGCAHSAELKSPRSQAAKIERTRSTFADATEQLYPGSNCRLSR